MKIFLSLKSLFGSMALWGIMVTSAWSQQGKQENLYKDLVTGKSGKYTIQKPQGGGNRNGYLLFFHGSGNTDGYASVFPTLAKVADEFRLVPVALQAPNSAHTWANAASGPGNKHEAYVRSFIDKELRKGGSDKIYFVGFSAGSTFLSGDLFPRFISDYRGGAVLLCGGGGPVALSKEVFKPLALDVAQRFPLYFYIQQKDFLFQQTTEGIMYWRQRNATVSYEFPEGGTHCGFDLGDELRKGLRKIVK